MQIISVTCSCGREYRLSEALAGKRIRCRQCDNVVEVPLPEVVDLEGVAEKVRAAPIRTDPPRLRPPPDEEPAPPPRRKKRRRRREGGGGLPISIGPGIIAGTMMMLFAVVWFIAGLYFGWIFSSPPILFVLGIVVFVKSLMGYED